MTQPARGFRTDVLIAGLIFAFTAVPLDVRLPSRDVLLVALSLNFYPIDVAANVLGYIPLGMALRGRGFCVGLLFAGLLSAFAEAVQLFTPDRMPGVVDIGTNVAGAALGLLLAARRPLFPEVLLIGPRHAALAGAGAFVYLLFGSAFTVEAVFRELAVLMEAPPWMNTSSRGDVDPGTVEAHLSFDGEDNEAVSDDSANRLRGVAVNEPTLSQGVIGSAISLNGKQWIDLGNPVSLRLTGSVTLSALVKATRFPIDDAAIISSLSDNELGYQLDLTVDQGPRTIGLKIADASGRLMARYGRTPLALDRWYHVAGVYDSESQTLDVYLNGVRDNGCLMGTVTGRQLPSGRHVFVGRRAGTDGFEFIGSIDEAKIESKAKPAAEIVAEASAAMHPGDSTVAEPSLRADPSAEGRCDTRQLPRIAGPLVVLGMLIALACAVLTRRQSFVLWTLGLCLVTGATAGVWGSSTAVTVLSAIWCVPLGGTIVLAASSALRTRRRPAEERFG